MPRIRSLKPEALQHRKVGRLSDRDFRLWVGMLTQADDSGRLVADADQLRLLVFGYHPRVRTAHVEAALACLDELGLLAMYLVNGVRYAQFPSWFDHQKVDHPTPSKYPDSEGTYETHASVRERSRILASIRGGSIDRSIDLKPSEGKTVGSANDPDSERAKVRQGIAGRYTQPAEAVEAEVERRMKRRR